MGYEFEGIIFPPQIIFNRLLLQLSVLLIVYDDVSNGADVVKRVMVVVAERVVVVVTILYCKRTHGFSVIIQFSSDFPQLSDYFQILWLLILSVERNPDSSANLLLEKLGLPQSMHFIIATKTLAQPSVDACMAMLRRTELLFGNRDSHHLNPLSEVLQESRGRLLERRQALTRKRRLVPAQVAVLLSIRNPSWTPQCSCSLIHFQISAWRLVPKPLGQRLTGCRHVELFSHLKPVMQNLELLNVIPVRLFSAMFYVHVCLVGSVSFTKYLCAQGLIH